MIINKSVYKKHGNMMLNNKMVIYIYIYIYARDILNNTHILVV